MDKLGPLERAFRNGSTVKPDFSEANKFAVLKRGFKEQFDKAYNDFWTRRNMEIPNGDWRVVAERNKERDGIK